MMVVVPMTEGGEAEQGKAPDGEQENKEILVLSAPQQDSQTGSRQNGRQHPLVKSGVGEETASQEGKANQQNRHQ